MNETHVTVSGVVGSDPRAVVFDDHLPITSFRLGATTRKYDRSTGSWVDGDTTWVTVTCFRALARNVAKCVARRDRVVVRGRLRVRQWRREDGGARVSVEVEADTVGHDLAFGTSVYTRTVRGERGVVPGRVAAGELARMVEEADPGPAPQEHDPDDAGQVALSATPEDPPLLETGQGCSAQAWDGDLTPVGRP